MSICDPPKNQGYIQQCIVGKGVLVLTIRGEGGHECVVDRKVATTHYKASEKGLANFCDLFLGPVCQHFYHQMTNQKS